MLSNDANNVPFSKTSSKWKLKWTAKIYHPFRYSALMSWHYVMRQWITAHLWRYDNQIHFCPSFFSDMCQKINLSLFHVHIFHEPEIIRVVWKVVITKYISSFCCVWSPMEEDSFSTFLRSKEFGVDAQLNGFCDKLR